MGGDGGEEGWSTLHVSNIPLETSRFQLEQLFSDIGPLKKCFVVKTKPNSKSTVGFVTFAMTDDCRAALESKDLKLGENFLKVKLAPDTKQRDRKQNPAAANQDQQKQHVTGQRSNPRKARLIVRNLSFKATDESIRGHFSKFGELTEVNILKKPNGQMVGCAFIQFDKINHAAKAILEANAKPFLGRPVAVDWAVPKEVFRADQPDVKDEVKEEEEIKEEDIKEEPMDEDDADVTVKEDDSDVEEDGEEEDVEDEEDEEDSGDDSGIEDAKEKERRPAHNHAPGHDIDEGKTVFIKNLAYETDEEDLRDMMEENFGPLYFAKLVLDKIMQHPRGTGFVKFKSCEDAAKCVEVSEGKEGIFLDKRRLTCCLAIKKDQVEVKQNERKEKEAKDSRNLYLAREGIIREGTKAAIGVSPADLAKRKELEKYKRNMLKNLNMFVSSTRLCIRNLPPTLDDRKLRKLVADEVNKGVKIKEAKVMRDMRKVVNGVGTSKEYGFVSFGRHEDALAALRSINNNPEIFGPDRRPIVDFSIENRKALVARQKREEKSRTNNPNFKGEKKGSSIVDRLKNTTPGGGRRQQQQQEEEGRDGKKEFSGMAANPKVKNLPKHSGEKVRHNRPKISRKELRKQELERKNPKLKQKRKLNQDLIIPERRGPEPEQKKAKKQVPKETRKDLKETKEFDSIVNSYRNKFANNEKVVKKWFDT